MNIFPVKLFKVNCCQRRLKVFNLVETSDVEVSTLSSHCVTTKKLPSSIVNFRYK